MNDKDVKVQLITERKEEKMPFSLYDRIPKSPDYLLDSKTSTVKDQVV